MSLETVDDIELLLDVFPPTLRQTVLRESALYGLLEVILDLGRPPEARYVAKTTDLAAEPVAAETIAFVVERIGAFSHDNRAGIPRTLHRISALRNRTGGIIGLTCRVGRAVFGTLDIVQDLVHQPDKSILLLGPPRCWQNHPAARGGPRAGRRGRQTGRYRRYLKRNCRRRRYCPRRYRAGSSDAGALTGPSASNHDRSG